MPSKILAIVRNIATKLVFYSPSDAGKFADKNWQRYRKKCEKCDNWAHAMLNKA